MLNVIRMEIARMLKMKSFYVILIIGLLFSSAMQVSLANSMNDFYDGKSNEVKQSVALDENSDVYLSIKLPDSDTACPNNICGSFIATASMMVSIFAAFFVSEFYKSGYCKNVVGAAKHKYYFQIADFVCVMIYSAILLTVNTVISCGLAAALIHAFEFAYIKEFALFLLGEYLICVAMGTAAVTFTTLFKSKIPVIIYSILSSSTIIIAVIETIDTNVRNWGFSDFSVEKYFPSLYQLNFYGDLPMANNTVIHAVVLSFVWIMLYNILGSVTITKRDI